MSKNSKEQYLYTQNRELSWLRFNRRVLEEAADTSVPLLERLKFVSIFSSNMDEFFMVRVGSLFDLACMTPTDTDNKTGWTAGGQLRRIYRAVPKLLSLKEKIYKSVMKELEDNGICDIMPENLSSDNKKKINRFFKAEMLPFLSPVLIGANHPVPHIVNKNLYTAALLQNKKGHKAIGIVPVPQNLPPYLLLPCGTSFVRTENILLHFLPTLFGAYTVRESCVFCVTRNADINLDDEKFEDFDGDEEKFRSHMKKLLKKRDHLGVIRLELNAPMSQSFEKKLSSLLKVETQQVFSDVCPLNMKYVFRLIDELPKDISAKLLCKPYKGRMPEDLYPGRNIFAEVQKRDHLSFYPYDSVEPFLKLLNEAAENPHVVSIKITIYRLASSSKIAAALCYAAKKGKEVLVLMELRARFDEENNLNWSEILEESGCRVIYGTEGFKCHSKVCLITLKNKNKTSYITQIGTGNYNEKTNAMYTDLSLITANRLIGEDAAAFFRNMQVNRLDGTYGCLCVSPFGIKSMLLEKIDEQIALKENGYICIKVNSVTEREIIDKLAEASRAGVEIRLIVRGICCILPGVKGYTDNVHVISIVGRFLEHARVYLFGRGNDADIYISSADLMTRNLNRRVEIACPVYDDYLRKQIRRFLESQLHDTKKASEMLRNGAYRRKESAAPFDSQEYFTEQSLHDKSENHAEKFSFVRQIKKLYKHFAFKKGL